MKGTESTESMELGCRTSRAIVALANSALTIVWHLLSVPGTAYVERGSDHHQSKLNQAEHKRPLIRDLEKLSGSKVTLTPAV